MDKMNRRECPVKDNMKQTVLNNLFNEVEEYKEANIEDIKEFYEASDTTIGINYTTGFIEGMEFCMDIIKQYKEF